MRPSLKWSWKLGSPFGIGIYVHWTFLILIAWVAFSHWQMGHSLPMVAEGVLFVLAIFACVTLHEFGHALAARRYGIATRDITLLPIGGVASLQRIPREPGQELWITAAGPLVNVLIAAVLLALINLLASLRTVGEAALAGGPFLAKLLWVNVFLVLFNLVPAFPMDGGRILRALLAFRLDHARATRIAATTGQAFAIVLGFLGVLYNPFLLLIAIFVYLGAEAESSAVSLESTFRNVRVGDAMMTRFRALSPGDSLEVAVSELLAGAQQDFPVVDAGRVVGLLERGDLLRALARGGREGIVADSMRTSYVVADIADPLDRTFQHLRESGLATAAVLDHGGLAGLLTLENIGEYAMIQSTVRRTAGPPDAATAARG
jgi:Zn-dependent protease